jgi:hypothetical protein
MDTPINATSAAYEASRVVKTKPGKLYGMTGYNSKVSAQFILIHDANALPATGGIPVIVLSVAASSPFSLDYNTLGRDFSHGIVVSNSSTGPTQTIGSADCWFDVQYR